MWKAWIRAKADGPRSSISAFIKAAPLLALIATLLVGCDQKALLEKFVPKDDDAFARHFLDVIRAGDYAAAEQMLDVKIRGDAAMPGLRELNGLLANHGEPLSVEIVGVNVFSNTSNEGTTRTTNLTYQIQFPDSWAAGLVTVGHPEGAMSIVTARFDPVPASLETMNHFSFAGKTPLHYLVFAAAIAVPVFILTALVICIRSRIRRKWLWILFILVGFGQFQLNWATGQTAFQPLSILLCGASSTRSGLYAPWVLAVAIPVGAIVFLACRRRLLANNSTTPPPLLGSDHRATLG